jgi:ribosomal protein S3
MLYDLKSVFKKTKKKFMGQKINPISLRLQTTNRFYDSCWYSDYFYSDLISQNIKIQEYLNSILKQIHYPIGRFFIQSSQKNTKIFLFFCSPLKSRKIRSNIFKVKVPKINRKTPQYLKNQPSFYMSEFSNLSITTTVQGKSTIGPKKNLFDSQHRKPFTNIELKASSKSTPRKALFVPEKEEKFLFLKYYLYSKYLESIYANIEFKSFFEFWSSHQPITKKVKGFQTLTKGFFSLKKQVDRKRNSNDKFYERSRLGTQMRTSTYSQIPVIKQSLSHTSGTFPIDKRANPSEGKDVYLENSLFFNQKLIQPNLEKKTKNELVLLKENHSDFYKFLNKLTYRKHIESILTQHFLVNMNFYSIKVHDPYRSALFLAEDIVYFLERRIAFRRIKNRILKEVQFLPGIKGIRITCSGRVGGRSKKAQRAKLDTVKYGQTSLHVFSSRIDFASKTALTPFGLVGVKVWLSFNE